MANVRRPAERPVKAIELISDTRVRLQDNKFTADTWVKPPNRRTLQLRESFIVMLNAISENLDLQQKDPLRTKYPELFREARGLHGQCTILDHKYEVADVKVEVDWHDVWKTVTERYRATGFRYWNRQLKGNRKKK